MADPAAAGASAPGAEPAPGSGRLAGATHMLALRVYYEDTDAGGIVYHAGYLRFAERGRTEMLRLLGIDHRQLRELTGIVFTVRRLAVEFRRPARLDDAIEVRTTPVALGGATVDLRQGVWRGAEELARLDVQVACMRVADGRPARLPKMLRDRLFALISADLASTHRPGGPHSQPEATF
jgi:acyl-CoA thioester hydrolase